MAPAVARQILVKVPCSAAAALTPLPRTSSARCQSPSTPSTPSSGRLSSSWNHSVVGLSAQRPLQMTNAGRSSGFTSKATSSTRCSASSSTQATNTSPSKDVLRVWRAADAVCFDVDSTVCVDEGIDELAAYCGAGEAVAAWTTKAMSGSVPFETALAARLEIFNPSAADVAGFLRDHPPRLNPGIGELVKRLKARGTEVYLISGGFRQMIEPVAALLDIPVTNIFANRLLFEEGSGAYAGFDANEPTSRSGGKARAIAQLKQEHGFKSLVMVGDGATDLEARQPGGADMFIGYGGIQVRKVVAAESDWFAMDFQDLIDNV